MGRRLETGLVVAVLCGSAVASATAASPRISPKFVSKVDDVCAAIDARFNHTLGAFPYPKFNPEHPDRKTLVLVGRHFAKALPIRRTIPGRLRGLGEPASGRAAWDAIRSLALQDNQVGTRQVSAALAGDTKTFVATVHELEHLHAQIGKSAVAAGFPKSTPCGDVF